MIDDERIDEMTEWERWARIWAEKYRGQTHPAQALEAAEAAAVFAGSMVDAHEAFDKRKYVDPLASADAGDDDINPG